MDIIPGNSYWMDGKTMVTVLKPINRSKTMFTVEIPGKGVYTVDKDRLKRTIN